MARHRHGRRHGHRHGHRSSRSSTSRGKRADRSAAAEQPAEPLTHTPEERHKEWNQEPPKDPSFWQSATATNTWNYIQSGSTTRDDGAPGPSTRGGDRELGEERARHMQEEQGLEMTAYGTNPPPQPQPVVNYDYSTETRRKKSYHGSRGGPCCFL